MTGEDCYVLKVADADASELETLVDQFTTIGDPITSIVMSTQVTHRDLGAPTNGRTLQPYPPGQGDH